ncbi:MAG: CmpA/NrtA family ABC transporter substrate-binding protein [Desulfovibrionaceae bacterium]
MDTQRAGRGNAFLVLAAGMCLALCLCMGQAWAADSGVPRLNMSYVFTTHHTPLMVAAMKGDAFKASGAYLKEMVPREKYELMGKDGKPLAVITLIVSKSGSETATMFAMGQLDLGLASSTAFMSGIDKGTKMKMLCPLHVDGMSMVFPPDSTVNGWADVEKQIKAAGRPFKVGYHSPTSSPRVVFEGALFKSGYKITENANDPDADILLVDLKSTSNLIPALVSKQVDCWVGPEPHPSVAEFKHVGHIGLDSRDLPPAGEWQDFPCCAMGASERLIATHPEIVQAMTDLMTNVGAWCNKNMVETAALSADWIGVPAAAVEKSTIVYTTTPSANWLKGEDMFLAMLQRMGKFKGALATGNIEAAKPVLFDFSFVNKSLKKS